MHPKLLKQFLAHSRYLINTCTMCELPSMTPPWYPEVYFKWVISVEIMSETVSHVDDLVKNRSNLHRSRKQKSPGEENHKPFSPHPTLLHTPPFPTPTVRSCRNLMGWKWGHNTEKSNGQTCEPQNQTAWVQVVRLPFTTQWLWNSQCFHFLICKARVTKRIYFRCNNRMR